MKRYRFILGLLEAEKMWDFSMENEVNFHFCMKIPLKDNEDPVKDARFVYEGFMSEQTYLLFKLAVPFQNA